MFRISGRSADPYGRPRGFQGSWLVTHANASSRNGGRRSTWAMPSWHGCYIPSCDTTWIYGRTTRVTELVTKSGSVIGAVIETHGDFEEIAASRAVVLATGGFSHDG